MATETKVGHTPGPWMVSPVSTYVVCPVSNPKFGICITNDEDESTPQDGANARLIAAAPELLDALRILYEETADYIRINNLGDVHHNRSMQFARDAIAKAEGL